MTDDGRQGTTSPSFRLDGRTALVTGAGRGLGAGMAVAVAEAGAEVLLMSRTEAELDEVAGRIRADGGKATVIVSDVTDAAATTALIRGLDRLDILVNNAGTNRPQMFLEVTQENLDAMLDLNLRAAYLVAQAAVIKMLEDPNRRERGGAVVHISSQMGHVGAPLRTVYAMTKHGLEGLNKAMAIELAPKGIRVNSVGPTFVETPLSRPMLADEAFHEEVLSRIPMGHLASIEDIAAAVVFLASPAAAMITGASLVVDGGWTAR